MQKSTILALRMIIVLSLIGSLVVQTVIVPLLWMDLAGESLGIRSAVASIIVFGVLTMQVFAVCVWQLLTLVRQGAVFSEASFRYVDVIIGAVLAAAADVFALAVLLARGEAAPGVVGIVCGFALVLGGMALLVVVMRALLAQAIRQDEQARTLRTELDGVI